MKKAQNPRQWSHTLRLVIDQDGKGFCFDPISEELLGKTIPASTVKAVLPYCKLDVELSSYETIYKVYQGDTDLIDMNLRQRISFLNWKYDNQFMSEEEHLDRAVQMFNNGSLTLAEYSIIQSNVDWTIANSSEWKNTLVNAS